MAENAVDPISLKVTSPKSRLVGLDNALSQLTVFRDRLQEVQALLQKPINADFGIKSPQAASRLRKARGGSLNVDEIAKQFGFDAKQFEKFIAQEQKAIVKNIKRSQNAIESSTRNFRSAGAADRAISMFSKRQSRGSLGTFLGSGGAGGTGGAKLTGSVELVVNPSQIRATLAPGMVELLVPPSQVRGAGVTPGGAAGTAAAATAAVAATPGPAVPADRSAAGSSGLVERSRRSRFRDGVELSRVQREVNPTTGQEVLRLFEQVEEGFAATGETIETSNFAKQRRREIEQGLRNTRNRLATNLAGASDRDVQRLNAEAAGELSDLIGSDREGLSALVGEDVVGRVEAKAVQLRSKATVAERKLTRLANQENFETELDQINRRFTAAVRETPEQTIRALRRQADDLGRLLGTDGGATLREGGVTAGRLRAARRLQGRVGTQISTLEAATARSDREAQSDLRQRLAKSRAKSEAEAERQSERAAAEANRRAERLQLRGKAVDELRRELAAGGTVSGRTVVREGDRVVGSRVQTRRQTDRGSVVGTFDTQKGTSSLREFIRVQNAATRSTERFGSNIIDNTLRVTGWAAGVAVLYGTLDVARNSLNSLIRSGAQMARLDQVFRGVGGSTQQLMDDVLRLAAAEGQASDSAIESAIAWSRLGLTRLQVNEAVRQSLIAANVAEISPAEATERLAAIMQQYKLEVGDLAGVLGQLNEVSNTYRVTNRDLLDGISRSGSVAKQAGLELSELIGIIGAGVGATGQSGSNIGNSIKTLLTKLGNPDLQSRLSEQFQLNLTTPAGDLQDMSSALGELFVRYQELNEAQRASLRFQVAGAFQSSRLAAILDNYVKAQELAINAQLNLNSAEEENARILATVQSQLQGLGAELERFIFIQGNRGPATALRSVVELLGNVVQLANTPIGGGLVTGLLAMSGVLAARMALTAVEMNRARESAGFLAQSGRRVQQAWASAGRTLERSVATFQRSTIFSGKRGREGFTGGFLDLLGQGRRGASRAARSAGRRQVALNRLLSNTTRQWTISTRVAAVAQLSLARAMGTASIAAVRLLTGLRGVVVAVRTLAVTVGLPLLAITAVVYGINKAFEFVGRSAESARRRMAGFNEEAQRAKSAANAAGQAARFFATVGAAIPSSPREGQLEQGAGAASAAAALRLPVADGLKEALKVLEDTGDATELLLRLEEARTQSIQRQREERVAARQAVEDETAALEKELDRVKDALSPDQNLVAELENQLAGAAEKMFELSAGADEFSEALRQAFEAQAKQETSAITARGDFFRSAQATTEEGRIQNELLALQAEESFSKRRIQRLTQELSLKDRVRKQQEEATRQLEDSLAKEEKKLVTMRQQAAVALPQDVTGVPASVDDSSEIRAQLAVVEGIERQIARSSSVDPDRTGINERLSAIAKESEQRRVREGQLRGRLEFARQLDGARLSSDLIRAEIDSSGVGNATEALLRRRDSARNVVARERARAEAGGADAIGAQLRLQVATSELERAQLDLAKQRYELRKQELQTIEDINRESRDSLVGAGPEGLVRRVAALRAISSGIDRSPGLFALGTDLQQELARISPNVNPRLRSIRNQRRLLGGNIAPNLPALQAPGLNQGPAINQSAALALELRSTTQASQGLRAELNTMSQQVQAVTAALAGLAASGGGGGGGQFGGSGGAGPI